MHKKKNVSLYYTGLRDWSFCWKKIMHSVKYEPKIYIIWRVILIINRLIAYFLTECAYG